MKNTPLFTALVTPFTDEGAIDYPSLDRLIQEQVGNGLLLCGSTGEGLSLTAQEKLDILRYVCDKDLSVPLLAGVGGFQLEDTLSWLKQCEELPLDGYLMVTPIYARPGPYGQLEWFTQLMDAVSKPCMLYNNPSRVGCSLALEALQDHPNLWAIKEASGSLEAFRAYRDAAPDLAIYSGCDDWLPEVAQEGACGLVSVMANAWPTATKKFVQRSLEGKSVSHWLPAVECVNRRNPISIKVLLHALGWIQSSHLRMPLSTRDGSIQEELITHNTFIHNDIDRL